MHTLPRAWPRGWLTPTPPHRPRLAGWGPAQARLPLRQRLLATLGALLGLLATGAAGWAAWRALGHADAAPVLWLMAPMGASAVLLFAVPASPLAQPWSVLGGNLVAAALGVACAGLLGPTLPAAALAAAAAIGVMLSLRCLHPPSGAVALTAVLGGPAVQAAGWSFLLAPVLLDSTLLLASALLFHRLAGGRYPQAPAAAPSRPALQAAVTATGDVSVDAAQLDRLLQQLRGQALDGAAAGRRCRDLLRGPVAAVEFATELAPAWALLHAHALPAVAVTDRWQHVIGLLQPGDFLRAVAAPGAEPPLAGLRRLLRRTPATHSDKPEVVGQVMGPRPPEVPGEAPWSALLPLLAAEGPGWVAVVDGERRLLGLLGRADALRAWAVETLPA